jgi:uncharacterized protein
MLANGIANRGIAVMNKACVLFGRYPEPGQGKTRLAAALGEESTFLLYQALLADTAWKVSQVPEAMPVAALANGEDYQAPPPDPLGRAFFETFQRIGQEGDSFGQRLGGTFRRVFGLGFSRIVLVGADSPELSLHDLTDAFAKLEQHDLVLGPAADGGYYLIALKRFYSSLFENITWSTSAVFAETVHKAEALGLTVATTAQRWDVDFLSDLAALKERRTGRPERTSSCPATDAWLKGQLAEQQGTPPLLSDREGEAT